jgi:tRNA modification GTPase
MSSRAEVPKMADRGLLLKPRKDRNDTIFALSSGRPPAAIAVVRVCGARAGDVLRMLAGRLPEPRVAALTNVRDPGTSEIIDQALILWFPGPASETGEDMAELQLHGGRAVITAVLTVLDRIEGLRLAEPGEFARRAFEHGRIDLTRAEALADLIYADTQAQRRQALRQLRGLLGDRAEAWRRRLIEAMALVEAGIDFPDEGDVPTELIRPALDTASQIADEIDKSISASSHGERLREGLVVAIAGSPNVGKSSLLNRIARRDAAIVSPVPGTTRDVIEVHLDLEGYPVTLLDTAGIHDSLDPIEQEGIRRARARAAEADLVLWVADASRCEGPVLSDVRSSVGTAATWVIANKGDLLGADQVKDSESRFADNVKLVVSAATGAGLERLLSELTNFAKSYFESTEPALVTRERQRRALQDTAEALRRAIAEGPIGREEVIAEDLRLAATALGRLVGRVDVEDVLDAIFRDFCIGK